ncbi:MAG: putative toxin-antitoxin system toxin component, PIN family [Actinobacteria bacterium]|nr:putative toxin-antitoxin system toxin component, PIN family [Cyanobacteriota bacterium]MCL5771835.1 putative toxin-antitoxin system toxin component, PIN family [Actinomycetota bacterium]
MSKRFTIILDTNVLISAIVFKGTPEKILKSIILENKFDGAISPEILAELVKKLKFKFDFPDKLIKEWELIFKNTFKNMLPSYNTKICRDSDDNKILDLAVFSKAKYIITGDKDLLSLGKYKDTSIITPNDFLNLEF